MDFQSDRGSPGRRDKPPPNYSSRPVQYRLMVLVGLCMAVLVLISEARKPENWYWMGFQRPGEPVSDTLDVDIQPGDFQPGDAQPPAETKVPSTFAQSSVGVDDAATDPQGDALSRARYDAWSQVMAALDAADQGHRDRLNRVLKAARDDREIDPDQLQSWSQTLAKIGAAWKLYLQDARSVLEVDDQRIPPPQREQWQVVLKRLDQQWSVDLEPPLRAFTHRRPLRPDERDSLAGLQSVLDRLALLEVRDDTVYRYGEKFAWFRMLEILDRADPHSLHRSSHGPASYLQLYDQPEQYRGKLVTIRGVARAAQHVTALKNVYGFSSYYVFWVWPAGGPNSPIVVYALETPSGFPEISPQTADGEMTQLREQVQFDGYFFKRWVYAARDGPRTAPLMLAKSPTWQPCPASEDSLPSVVWVVLMVAATAAGAAGIAIVVYRRSNASSPAVVRHSLPMRSEPVPSPAEADLSPPVDEALRQLSQAEGDDIS